MSASARSSRRERRTVAIGLTTIAAIVGIGRGVPAWRTWSTETVASAREIQTELNRSRADVHGAKTASDSLAVRTARLDSSAHVYLEGRTPTAAAAGLASALSRIAETAGVRVASIGARVDSSSTSSVRAIASLNVVGDVRALTRLLAGVERGPLLLSVASVSVAQSEVAAGDDRAEALRIEMSVEGLVAPAAGGRR